MLQFCPAPIKCLPTPTYIWTFITRERIHISLTPKMSPGPPIHVSVYYQREHEIAVYPQSVALQWLEKEDYQTDPHHHQHLDHHHHQKDRHHNHDLRPQHHHHTIIKMIIRPLVIILIITSWTLDTTSKLGPSPTQLDLERKFKFKVGFFFTTF